MCCLFCLVFDFAYHNLYYHLFFGQEEQYTLFGTCLHFTYISSHHLSIRKIEKLMEDTFVRFAEGGTPKAKLVKQKRFIKASAGHGLSSR